MDKKRLAKLGLVIALIGLALWKVIPSLHYFRLSPEQRQSMDPSVLDRIKQQAMRLGLDLQGGVHMVMEVDLSEVNRDEQDDTVNRAMKIINNRVDQFGLTEPVVQRQGLNRIIVELPGIQDLERARNLIGRTALLEFVILKPEEDIRLILEKIDYTLAGIDTLKKSSKDTTDLFEEEEEVEDRPFSNLLLERRMGQDAGKPPLDLIVTRENLPRVQAILAREKVQRILIESDVRILLSPENDRRALMDGGQGARLLYFLNATEECTGAIINDARVQKGQGLEAGQWQITFRTTSDGTRIFRNVTGANVNNRMAIVLDNTVYSAPEIRDKIRDGSSRITGSFTLDEAQEISIVLRAGALPADVKVIYEDTVGPSLGADSIRKGLRAAAIGLGIIIIFMVIYYGMSGIIADMALFLNMIFIFGFLVWMGATLTLPGIAGLILTIGMAVDANVLVFERIREEIRSGKTTRAAIANGYSRAFWTIFDANITTFLTAIILYQFGTGPIKGFAYILMVGIISSVFTAVFVTRIVFDYLVINFGMKSLSIGIFEPFKKTTFSFITIRKAAFALSGIMIVVGVLSLGLRGGPDLSIDFRGGTLLQYHFDPPISVEEIRNSLGKIEVSGINLATSEIKRGSTQPGDVFIRYEEAEEGTDVSNLIENQLAEDFEKNIPVDREEWILRREKVGPKVGAELKGNAVLAILFSMAVILAYITFRFEFKFAVAAVAALLHDVIITIGIFSILSKEISLAIVAALLTIVGYSLNDTIVVFDRIREDLRLFKRDPYPQVINRSINETLSRTIITSFTTITTVLALFFLGGEVIHDFSFALIIGVVVGSYSSIFVASPIVVEWFNRSASGKAKTFAAKSSPQNTMGKTVRKVNRRLAQKNKSKR